MNVRDRMTRNPFTVKKTQSVTDARELMKKEKIHRLPVIEDNGQLIGIITEKDILYASPSPASTL
ncbi:MAG: CBS domain-containing protein, partial [Spirochaetaceae bacterium]|nr:CBS domain-containing protein [Spirochaetaceae bacterium]